MKSILKMVFAFSILFSFTTKSAQAIVDPLAVPNNKFGIHLNDENDLDDAANLVNSSDGDWGYVTFVIREDERDTVRWQRAFDKINNLHLIPIVRLATTQQETGWSQPKINDIDEWVNFLESLKWVTENRYIVVGNEVNHATEWGGEISPEEYSDYYSELAKRLNMFSSDYFIMPAGLDASAPDANSYMNEKTYLKRMIAHDPGILEYIDGLASHSYPNPGFVGKVDDTGKKSIRGYEWELEYLKELGLEKELPVFITETGWAHDNSDSNRYLSTDDVSNNYKKAFEDVWSDERIVAITPFIMNYPAGDFAKFSFKDENGVFYDFYQVIRNLSKVKGKPVLDSIENTKKQPPSYYYHPLVNDNTAIVYNIKHNFWLS